MYRNILKRKSYTYYQCSNERTDKISYIYINILYALKLENKLGNMFN